MHTKMYPPSKMKMVFSLQSSVLKYGQSTGTKKIAMAAAKIRAIEMTFINPEKRIKGSSSLSKGMRAPSKRVMEARVRKMKVVIAAALGSLIWTKDLPKL